jgi:hypothetical protein
MKTEAKFVLYSSHDTQLAALLPTFGEWDWPIAAVRSHFLFELWDVDGIVKSRFAFNGKVLNISFLDGRSLVSYSALKKTMASLGFFKHCLVPSWPLY